VQLQVKGKFEIASSGEISNAIEVTAWWLNVPPTRHSEWAPSPSKMLMDMLPRPGSAAAEAIRALSAKPKRAIFIAYRVGKLGFWGR
jgi:hypothetical protein